MAYDQLQYVFQLCSYALSYPDEKLKETFKELQDEIESLPYENIKQELLQFNAKLDNYSLEELISNYVYTFDFGKKTNLYVTYMTSGEQRERGGDLLYLKNIYSMNGFQATETELPDYLPMMLEFAGNAENETLEPIFGKFYENVVEIQNHLTSGESMYSHILNAVIFALNEAGITDEMRRSE